MIGLLSEARVFFYNSFCHLPSDQYMTFSVITACTWPLVLSYERKGKIVICLITFVSVDAYFHLLHNKKKQKKTKCFFFFFLGMFKFFIIRFNTFLLSELLRLWLIICQIIPSRIFTIVILIITFLKCRLSGFFILSDLLRWNIFMNCSNEHLCLSFFFLITISTNTLSSLS